MKRLLTAALVGLCVANDVFAEESPIITINDYVMVDEFRRNKLIYIYAQFYGVSASDLRACIDRVATLPAAQTQKLRSISDACAILIKK
jgi:hypothetical protein